LRGGVGIDPAPHAELISRAVYWCAAAMYLASGPYERGHHELGLALKDWCARIDAERAEHVDDDMVSGFMEVLKGGNEKVGRGRPRNNEAITVAAVLVETLRELGITREHRIVEPLMKKVFDVLAIEANAKAAIQAAYQLRRSI
jgi:hypothetical protein